MIKYRESAMASRNSVIGDEIRFLVPTISPITLPKFSF
jgi:hypothetical protein